MLRDYNFDNKLPEGIRVGIAIANEISIDASVDLLEKRLAKLLQKRQQPLNPEEENIRKDVRDMLRNGKYRPTGRSKPASEYLLRSAGENKFPRINIAVDTINYLSLKYLLPISVWDIDLAETKKYLFRLGKDEKYVFNQAEQEIGLLDLVTGFAILNDKEIPIVNPVKDSLKTKTTPKSQNVIMAVYCPPGRDEYLQDVLQEFVTIMEKTTNNSIDFQVI